LIHQSSSVTEVNFDSRAIESHITGMDHEIGMLVIHAASGAQLSAKSGLSRPRCVSEI
jgi:hypothetical protein